MSTTNDPINWAALRRLCDEVTPGPWRVDGAWVRPDNDDHHRKAPIAFAAQSHGIGQAALDDATNAQFIAASRLAVPALLGMVRELAGALERIARLGDGENKARIPPVVPVARWTQSVAVAALAAIPAVLRK